MLKNDIDEIYELCKRVITEQPEAYCLFDFSPGTMGVLLYKDRKKLDTKSGPPDFNITIFCDGLTVRPSGKDAYEKTRKHFLNFWKTRSRTMTEEERMREVERISRRTRESIKIPADEQRIIRIVRFGNKTVASYVGTMEEAVQKAKEMEGLYGPIEHIE